VVLADTNILSTFAKISALPLLMQLFVTEGLGVVPAVYEELHRGVHKGYVVLQAAIELIQHQRIELVVPNAEETLGKSALPLSFDAGERETIAVARARGAGILTNERLVKNWCQRAGVQYWDLPGILRAFWRTQVLTQDQVRSLVRQIEAKDRIIFRDQDQIFAE
jgi:predicted nucleic acid-binding protein